MPAFAKNRTPSTDTKKPSKAAFFKVQAKLKMGQSGDKYEQEADSVAQQVVKNSNGNSVTKVQQKPTHLLEQKRRHWALFEQPLICL